MKPTIPEIGTILKLDCGNASVLLKGGKSCRGCGAGKLGLCKAGGDSMILAAKNTIGAQPGDTVLVGLDKDVQIKGYFLSYLFPLFALIAGSTLGYVLGKYFALPSLDVFMGFAALSAMTAYTFLRLRRLDRSNKMMVKKILGDETFSAEVKSDEEREYESMQ